jgi:hypothetical protein
MRCVHKRQTHTHTHDTNTIHTRDTHTHILTHTHNCTGNKAVADALRARLGSSSEAGPSKSIGGRGKGRGGEGEVTSEFVI